MNDEDTRSGSRWEPEDSAESAAPDTDQTSTTTEQPAAPEPPSDNAAPSDAPAASETADATPSRDWKDRFRGRTALAGAGIGLAAISGIGGFAIGHATADDSGRVGFVNNDGPGRDGRIPGGEGGDFRGPQDGDGTAPSQPDGSGDDAQSSSTT